MDVLIDNASAILDGFWLTIRLLVVNSVGALVLGTLMASLRLSPVPVMRAVAAVYITVFRNTPLLVLIVITYFGLPELGITPGFFTRISIAMSIYTSTFIAEALRSGVNAVPLGQAEAARSIGMPFTMTLTQVVLPQAVRATVPPMASVLIALTKNTSLAAGFGLAEATYRLKGLVNDYASDRWVIFFGIALGYIVIVEVISFGAARLERRWRVA
ncbi:MAG: amino acid ABC transporter permease [Aeromicrobium erythreum]